MYISFMERRARPKTSLIKVKEQLTFDLERMLSNHDALNFMRSSLLGATSATKLQDEVAAQPEPLLFTKK